MRAKYLIQEHFITDDGTITTEINRVKYLGIFLDNTLKFTHHYIHLTTCKINRMIGVFWKCLDIGIEIKKIIYYSLVEFHLNYNGLIVWGSYLARKLVFGNDINHIPWSKLWNYFCLHFIGGNNYWAVW